MIDLNKHLAEKVMGFAFIHDDEPYPFDSGDTYQNEGNIIFCDEWNPSENIEQAYQCLGEMYSWGVTKDPAYNIYRVFVVPHDGEKVIGKGESHLPTVCLTIARATSYDD